MCTREHDESEGTSCFKCCLESSKHDETDELLVNGEHSRKRKWQHRLCKNLFLCVPTRWVVMAMISFASFVVYALRINISVAIVAMTNATSDRSTVPVSGANVNQSFASCVPTAPTFPWDNTQQALILSAFFYAYPILQIPGGYLSTRFSAKYVVGVGLLSASLLSLLTPLAATLSTSTAPLVALRALQGLSESSCFPAFHVLTARWAPPLERSRMLFVGSGGILLGSLVTMPVAGWLCKCGFAGGWPSVFYMSGVVGLLWFVMWVFLVYDSPSRHPRISVKELKYIQTSLAGQQTDAVLSTPWCSILTSFPVWGIVAAHSTASFTFYTLLTCLPTFLKDTQKIDVKADGLLSSVPYLCEVLTGLVASFGTDFILTRGAPRTLVRKVNSFIGSLFPSVFLILCAYFGNSITTSVVFLCIAFAGGSCRGPGYLSAVSDIAPRYAGVVFGLANTLGAITGAAVPFIVKAIAYETPPAIDVLREQWREVFIIAAEINLFGAIIFAVIGSAELQPWARAYQKPHE